MERNDLDTISFERTKDYELIKAIITHPKIYQWVSDDFSPTPTGFKPVESDGIWYVLARGAEGKALGLWILVPQNAICWEVHTCLLPSAWGAVGLAAAKTCTQWVWSNTPCLRLVTNVPLYNRLALRFAEKSGFTEYGRNPRSYMKNGCLHDQIMLGLSK